MRILHTSDWHLGVHHAAVSRGPDHDLFLAWLLQRLEEDEVDVLIIAGDIFDSMQPSADALSRYYRFLADVSSTGVAQVVIIGGNHDSASRLDAPSEVLTALDVHVVGGIQASELSWDRCIIPLKNRAGSIEAVALAVPYVHEFRLGIRTTDVDQAEVRQQFRERFAALYSHLADYARAIHPQLPLVATGHLTLGPASRDDYPQEIHQVGHIDGLPESILDPRIQYTALGHIHRSYPVGEGRRAWYSGSPIAFSLPEAKTPRRVLRVDLSPDLEGEATVVKLDIPPSRALMELRAEPTELLTAVQDLEWTEPLPPLLFCRAVTDTLPSDLSGELHRALSTFEVDQRPIVVELRQERATPLSEEEQEERPALHDLRPEEVFETLCRGKGLSDFSSLSRAFATLSSSTEDDFQGMLDVIREEGA